MGQVIENIVNFKDLVFHNVVEDTNCAGSNLFVYLCVIFVPNVIVIT